MWNIKNQSRFYDRLEATRLTWWNVWSLRLKINSLKTFFETAKCLEWQNQKVQRREPFIFKSFKHSATFYSVK